MDSKDGKDRVLKSGLAPLRLDGERSTSTVSSKAAAALVQLKNADIGIEPLKAPHRRQCDSKTGLLHGRIHVQKQRSGMLRNNSLRFEFVLERQNIDGTNLPLLVAFHPTSSSSSDANKKKIKFPTPADWMIEKRHFAIALYSNQNEVLGEVGVAPYRNRNVVAFAVTVLDQVDSCVFYKCHSLEKIMSKDESSFREAEFARFTERAKKAARKSGDGKSTKLEDNEFYGCLLNESCQLLQPPKQTSGPELKVFCDSNYLSIFSSARPTLGKGMEVPSLNMNGRGTVTSNKNMQLVSTDGLVYVQVAKCDTNTYHVDFRAPFNPLQAFAFGIAQIVL